MATFNYHARFPQGITQLAFPGFPNPGGLGVPAEKILGLEWQAAITLAVSTTGNDTDPTRPARIVAGDWSAKPFATIQAAIHALPLLDHGRISSTLTDADVVINVGPGTFAGFQLVGSLLNVYLAGTRQLATPATGPSSGTATAGDSRTLTLTGAGWTADDLRGCYVNVTAGPSAGNIYLIAKNTSDTITFPAYMSPALGAGSVFTIEELATTLNAVPPPYTGIANYQGNLGYNRIVDLKIVSPGGTVAGVFVSANPGSVSAQRIAALGCYVGFSHNSGGILWSESCYAEGSSYAGFSCQNVIMNAPYRSLARNCANGFAYNNPGGWLYFGAGNGNLALNCGTGLVVEGVQGIVNRMICENCGYGVSLNRALLRAIGWSCDGATIQALWMHQADISFDGWLSGSGNVGFGLNASGGSNLVELNGITPTLTGALGDATVDGLTPIPWADLNVSGDYAVDAATGARINRR